jgi:galactonate dehydratase
MPCAGVTGWGEPVIEGRARTVEAAVHELSDYLVSRDPAPINYLWQAMYRAGFYRGGPILMCDCGWRNEIFPPCYGIAPSC